MGTILARIPYTRELGLVLEHAAAGEVRMLLPDQPLVRNLADTVHAGALFTFGETVAGVVAGIQTLDCAFPFARRAAIRYRQPARGAVHSKDSREVRGIGFRSCARPSRRLASSLRRT